MTASAGRSTGEGSAGPATLPASSRGSSGEADGSGSASATGNANTDERKSVNPVEWLPHSAPAEPPVVFVGDGSVEVTLELQRMTLRVLSLTGGGETRSVDYYDVVAKGSVERDEQTQFGVHFEVRDEVDGTFVLTVRPDPDDFIPDSIVLEAYDGAVVLDASL